MFKSRFRYLRMSGQLFWLLALIFAIVIAGAAISVFADGGSPIIAGLMAICAVGALIEAWQIGRRLR
jgi:cytochrome c oxidase subunit IV